MFETHKETRITSSSLTDSTMEEWRFVTQSFAGAWFYVTQYFRPEGTGEPAKRMLLVDDPSEFEGLISARSKDMWVEEVFLVTPRSVNGSDRWSIDPLIEVRKVGPYADSLTPNFIYEVDCPLRRYYSNRVDGQWENLESSVIYKRASTKQWQPPRPNLTLSEDSSYRVAQIMLAGIGLCGGDHGAGVKWLTTRVHGLGGKRPIEMVEPEEFNRLMDFIGRIEHGSAR